MKRGAGGSQARPKVWGGVLSACNESTAGTVEGLGGRQTLGKRTVELDDQGADSLVVNAPQAGDDGLGAGGEEGRPSRGTRRSRSSPSDGAPHADSVTARQGPIARP